MLPGSHGALAIRFLKLKAFEFLLPSFEEQILIVKRVELLFSFAAQIEQRVKDAQNRIDNLTQSILAKAFRGELVPQNPDDEPASVSRPRLYGISKKILARYIVKVAPEMAPYPRCNDKSQYTRRTRRR